MDFGMNEVDSISVSTMESTQQNSHLPNSSPYIAHYRQRNSIFNLIFILL